MNRDDVLRMAMEAGLYSGNPRTPGTGALIQRRIERFAALVADAARGDYHEGWEEGYKAGVIAEREECAETCETFDGWWDGNGVCLNCAAAIRARGEL